MAIGGAIPDFFRIKCSVCDYILCHYYFLFLIFDSRQQAAMMAAAAAGSYVSPISALAASPQQPHQISSLATIANGFIQTAGATPSIGKTKRRGSTILRVSSDKHSFLL